MQPTLNTAFDCTRLAIRLLLAIVWLTTTANAQDVVISKPASSSVNGENEVRQYLRGQMLQKKVPPEVVAARLSWAVPMVLDELNQAIQSHPDMQKWVATEKPRTPQEERAAERKANLLKRELLPQILAKHKKSYPPMFAVDFSDRILTFHSDITVKIDGDIDVKETIIIYNGQGQRSQDAGYEPNNDINRGITRDFPTRYLDENGLWSSVGFEITSVKLDGQNSAHHTERLTNGERLLIGDPEIYLEPGVHRYEIAYTTNRQLIFHDDKTELYWNVNGNGWVFTADSISCTVHFPESARIIEDHCYTGSSGSTDGWCRSIMKDDGSIHFFSTTFFNSWEGLTVAAAIPNGIILPPPSNELLQTAKDNYGLVLLAIMFLISLLFNFFIWLKKGKDPPSGTIYPQFEPPAGINAAEAGYISKQSYGPHLFAAALVDMAVHKQLRIDVEKKKGLLGFGSTAYHFEKVKNAEHNKGEVLKSRYGFSPESLYGLTAESGEYNSALHSKYTGLQSFLKNKHQADNGIFKKAVGSFATNNRYIAISIFLLIATIILSVVYVGNNYSEKTFTYASWLVGASIITLIIFGPIMKAYTVRGRRLADQIEGFRMYLKEAEQPLYNELTPPKHSLELFEKYLPYAIALKVENQWAKKFESQLQEAIKQGYSPNYYRSSSFGRDFNAASFSQSFGSGLSSTVASASTPPSSSSGGSSGGGSSGGGGGGGGGGGW